MSVPDPPGPNLGVLLLLGLLIAPALFCWVLLRRGYAPSLRSVVMTYTAILTGIGFVGRFWS